MKNKDAYDLSTAHADFYYIQARYIIGVIYINDTAVDWYRLIDDDFCWVDEHEEFAAKTKFLTQWLEEEYLEDQFGWANGRRVKKVGDEMLTCADFIKRAEGKESKDKWKHIAAAKDKD